MGQSVRSLSAEAGLTTAECLRNLHGQALRLRVGAQRLEGLEFSVARKALGLDRRASAKPPDHQEAVRELGEILLSEGCLMEKQSVGPRPGMRRREPTDGERPRLEPE